MLSENLLETASIVPDSKKIFKFNILKWLRLQKQIIKISAVYNFIDFGADYLLEVFLEF